MQISIHDYANNRVINARVPSYLVEKAEEIDKDNRDELIAEAIFSALGISSNNSEYMIGDFETVLADHNADSSRDARGIELLTQDFKTDALQALEDSKI